MLCRDAAGPVTTGPNAQRQRHLNVKRVGGAVVLRIMVGWHDQLAFVDGRAVESSVRAGDGEAGELLGVLRDGSERDVRAGQPAVVEADDRHVAGHVDVGAAQDVENAGGAAVVEHGDRGRQGVSVEQRAGRGGAVVLGETPGRIGGGVGEVVPLKGFAVAAAAFGSARARPPSMWAIRVWPSPTR